MVGSVALSSLRHSPCWWREVASNAQSGCIAAPFTLKRSECIVPPQLNLRIRMVEPRYHLEVLPVPLSGIVMPRPNACHWVPLRRKWSNAEENIITTKLDDYIAPKTMTA